MRCAAGSWVRGVRVDRWVGCQKGGRRKTLEKHDATGMPVHLTHEVYVNSIHWHLPSSLCTLSNADLQRIIAVEL